MKANELRIGNIASDAMFRYGISEISHRIIKGFSTMDGKEVYPDTLYSISIENLQGIPLTEEWLLKLGFKLTIGCTTIYELRFGQCHFIQIQTKDLKFRIIVDAQFAFPFPGPIEFAHQLQNLYFALTGEELTIK